MHVLAAHNTYAYALIKHINPFVATVRIQFARFELMIQITVSILRLSPGQLLRSRLHDELSPPSLSPWHYVT